ncbi:unnamed protein product [Ambrosiozyma monospora]|uniref:Unnamed protein product n=1 Tax=Ambrosiozyma monospora TaxID=43982 RepID=A0ACB5SX14_AMBMO|nr:unnamed protein product [Ambrosiozyma monospora]
MTGVNPIELIAELPTEVIFQRVILNYINFFNHDEDILAPFIPFMRFSDSLVDTVLKLILSNQKFSPTLFQSPHLEEFAE